MFQYSTFVTLQLLQMTEDLLATEMDSNDFTAEKIRRFNAVAATILSL
jgi:hypothetical protein